MLPKRSAWVLWLCAVPLLALSWYRPQTASSGRAAGLPTSLPEFPESKALEITDRFVELLGTSDVAWRTYRSSEGKDVYVVTVFHEENWKSVHPPHICLEGSNMTLRIDDRVQLPDGIEVGRIVAFSRSLQRDYLSLYLYGADGLVTASYPAFLLHHAPAALLRRSTSGFLLRVETWVGQDGEPAAQELCARFIKSMLPQARAAVRRG